MIAALDDANNERSLTAMSKINAAMFGILTAAAASWEGYDNDTQRRLRNLRNDASDALEQIRDYMSRGEQIRGRLPSVMDALLGLALANPTQTTPEILPTSTKLSRPVIDESSVSDLSWPLKTGTYDSKGRVTELGDLSRTFLALTFQELRAFIEGAAQEKSPSQAGLTQINRAANQLISVLSTLNLTAAQYKTVWTQLFNGSSNPSTDPHLGTPTIGAPLSQTTSQCRIHRWRSKTDRAMRIRIAPQWWQHWCGQRRRDHHVRSEWKDATAIQSPLRSSAPDGLYASGDQPTGFTIQLLNADPYQLRCKTSTILVSGGG
jgi:type II secretory pathway pseudopilin PulG